MDSKIMLLVKEKVAVASSKRPDRDTAISKEEVTDLTIDLENCKDISNFIQSLWDD